MHQESIPKPPLGYSPADPRYEQLMKTVMAIFDYQEARTVPLETGAMCHDLSGNVWEWCATKWQKYDENVSKSVADAVQF